MEYAVLNLTRRLLYDDHVAAGGRPPDLGPDTRRVTFDYQNRAPVQRPIIRTYKARIAVPSDHPTSWELDLGGDYRLLVLTRRFDHDADGVTIDGRIKSNYQVQLDPSSARIGPNSCQLRHWKLEVGETDALEVLSDEITGRIFREYQEVEVEDVVESVPEPPMAGLQETDEAQRRRWDQWPSVPKASLP